MTSRFAGIRAVSLDAAGTIFDFSMVERRSVERSLRQLATRYPQATALTITRLIAIRDTAWRELRDRAASIESIRYETFRRALGEIGVSDDDFASELTSTYGDGRANIPLFEDVLPVLAVLRRRFPLALVSNGDTHPDRYGLPDTFQSVVLAADHGILKPDPGLYLIAARELSLEPGQIVHVGDDPVGDVLGAQRAGMAAIWLNRRGRTLPDGIVPDAVIQSLAELPNHLM